MLAWLAGCMRFDRFLFCANLSFIHFVSISKNRGDLYPFGLYSAFSCYHYTRIACRITPTRFVIERNGGTTAKKKPCYRQPKAAHSAAAKIFCENSRGIQGGMSVILLATQDGRGVSADEVRAIARRRLTKANSGQAACLLLLLVLFFQKEKYNYQKILQRADKIRP